MNVVKPLMEGQEQKGVHHAELNRQKETKQNIKGKVQNDHWEVLTNVSSVEKNM